MPKHKSHLHQGHLLQNHSLHVNKSIANLFEQKKEEILLQLSWIKYEVMLVYVHSMLLKC